MVNQRNPLFASLVILAIFLLFIVAKPNSQNLPTSGGWFVRHTRVSSCTTAALINSICNTTVLWANAFPDTNYSAVCQIEAATGLPIVLDLATGTKTTTQIQIRIMNLTALASSGTVNCIAVSDK